jgi:hypothetical protein
VTERANTAARERMAVAGGNQGETEAEFVDAVEAEKPLPEIKERYDAMLQARHAVDREVGQLLSTDQYADGLMDEATRGRREVFREFIVDVASEEDLTDNYGWAKADLEKELAGGRTKGTEKFGTTDGGTSASVKRAQYRVMAARLQLEHGTQDAS